MGQGQGQGQGNLDHEAFRIPGLQVASGTGVEHWVMLMMEGSHPYVKQKIV